MKTHGTSLRRYHLWLPLPIPLALLRSYVGDHTGMQESNMESETKGQEPDKLLSTLVKDVLTFLNLRGKDDGQEND